MPSVSVVSKDMAVRMASLREEDVAAIHRLSAVGLSREEIVAYIARVAKGGSSFVSLETSGARPKVIQAYSFLRDENQYSVQYGLGHAEAAGWLAELSSAPDEIRARIHELVSTTDERKRGVQRSVHVSLEGAPSAKIPGGQSGGDDGGKRLLGEIIHLNPVPYGFYEFDPVDTNREGPDRFEAELGGGLCVRAQSKIAARRAAQIVAVDGRKRPEVLRFVRLKTADGAILPSSEIPPDFWDGRSGSLASVPEAVTMDALTRQLKSAGISESGAAQS